MNEGHAVGERDTLRDNKSDDQRRRMMMQIMGDAVSDVVISGLDDAADSAWCSE